MADAADVIYDQVITIARSASLSLTGESDDSARERASRAFDQIESFGLPALEAVARALLGPVPQVTELLGKVGEPALKYVEYAISKEDFRIASNAMQILVAIGPPALETLTSLLRTHSNHQIQELAAYILAGFGEKGISALAEDLRTGIDAIRIIVSGALSNKVSSIALARGSSIGYQSMVALLTQALSDSNAQVRLNALNGLQVARALSTSDIENALVDVDSRIRQAAQGALFQSGIDETNAHLLAKALEDKSGFLSAKAIETLSKSQYSVDPEALSAALIDVLITRKSNLPAEDFNLEIVVKALQTVITLSPVLHGRILQRLCELAFEYSGGVRKRSVFVAKRLDPDEFTVLVSDRATGHPAAAKAIFRLLGIGTDARTIVSQLSEADPGDIQKIAASQISLLINYYQDVLGQAKTSFWSAIISEVVGLLCLIGTLVFLLITRSPIIVPIFTGVSGVIAQFIAALQFFLFGETRKQLAYFHHQLNQTQRFLLANSVCESLEGEAKQVARTELVKVIASLESNQIDLPFAGVKK